MKPVFLLAISICLAATVLAQQSYNHNKMVFAPTNKPNTIIYNDTIYNGSNQFKTLFLRTGDAELIKLFQQHQSNKVVGNVLGIVGSFGIGFGVGIATSNNNHKGAGWAIVGCGLATSIVGGYLMLVGQHKLTAAIDLFNKKYTTKTTAGLGITNNGVGVVVKS